jgi:hypothetical protein
MYHEKYFKCHIDETRGDGLVDLETPWKTFLNETNLYLKNRTDTKIPFECKLQLGKTIMSYNVNAADAYARSFGSKLERLTDEQLALFETNPDGSFKFDNPETRAWMSIHPKSGERFPGYMTPCVYIVQSIENDYVYADGRRGRTAYGMFFDLATARNYIASAGLEEKAEIITCMKRDFRKSIWGWDVDGM